MPLSSSFPLARRGPRDADRDYTRCREESRYESATGRARLGPHRLSTVRRISPCYQRAIGVQRSEPTVNPMGPDVRPPRVLTAGHRRGWQRRERGCTRATHTRNQPIGFQDCRLRPLGHSSDTFVSRTYVAGSGRVNRAPGCFLPNWTRRPPRSITAPPSRDIPTESLSRSSDLNRSGRR